MVSTVVKWLCFFKQIQFNGYKWHDEASNPWASDRNVEVSENQPTRCGQVLISIKSVHAAWLSCKRKHRRKAYSGHVWQMFRALHHIPQGCTALLLRSEWFTGNSHTHTTTSVKLTVQPTKSWIYHILKLLVRYIQWLARFLWSWFYPNHFFGLLNRPTSLSSSIPRSTPDSLWRKQLARVKGGEVSFRCPILHSFCLGTNLW